MKRNNFVKLLAAGILTITPTYAFDWCTLFGLGCPPPLQSIDPNVPRAYLPNGNGLATADQTVKLVTYLNERLDIRIVDIYIPVSFGVPAPPPVNYKGQTYSYIHFKFSNGYSGVNAGLIIQKFQNFSSSPRYVLDQIAGEIGGTVNTTSVNYNHMTIVEKDNRKR